jgi:hypothetical protein
MTIKDHGITFAGKAALLNHQMISLASAIAFSIFGYTASVLGQGMKGPSGPIFAAVFIFTLMAMDVVLIKGRFNLKQVNSINLVSIVVFYFFSLTLPLFLTCPSPLSPLVALLAFSMITFLSFSLIAYLIRRVLVKILD